MQDLNKIVAAQLHSEGKDLVDVVAELEDLKERHARLVEKAKAYLDLESANNRLALQGELENEDGNG